ncbi:MAG: cyclic nucleotide-binding domain-containing protein [Acidimicrobiales bacterium]
MRIASAATTLSWIPSEAVTGVNKAAFASGFTHYDPPPPDSIDDLEELRRSDRFRFANRLAAWADIEDGRLVDAAYSGGVAMGSTTIRVGPKNMSFAAVALPDLRHEPEVIDGADGMAVRFVQTTGGRTALPAPRRVSHAPFVKFEAPTVWTTLALTLHEDGRAEPELVGASPFPRHWLYDADGNLSAKAGMADFKDWYRHAFGSHTPWGDEETPALVTAVETALERELSVRIMQGSTKPTVRSVKEGTLLTEQGQPGEDVFLLLDGVLSVDVDGEVVAEMGPGAIFGERAVLEGGVRTSTLRAITNCRVAVAHKEQLDLSALAEISEGHRRESQPDR